MRTDGNRPVLYSHLQPRQNSPSRPCRVLSALPFFPPTLLYSVLPSFFDPNLHRVFLLSSLSPSLSLLPLILSPPFFFFVLSPMSLVTVRRLHPSPSPRSSSYSVHPSAGAPAGAFVADGNGSTPEQVDAGRTIAHYDPLPPPVSRRLLPACQPNEWREKRRREGGTNGWVEEDKKILKLEDGGGNEGEQMSSRPSGLSSVTVASKIIQSKL